MAALVAPGIACLVVLGGPSAAATGSAKDSDYIGAPMGVMWDTGIPDVAPRAAAPDDRAFAPTPFLNSVLATCPKAAPDPVIPETPAV